MPVLPSRKGRSRFVEFTPKNSGLPFAKKRLSEMGVLACVATQMLLRCAFQGRGDIGNAIGQLHDNGPWRARNQVIGTHLAFGPGLALAIAHGIDHRRHRISKFSRDLLLGHVRVFDGVVKQAGHQDVFVFDPETLQDRQHVVEVHDIRFCTIPLVTMGFDGEFSRLLKFDAHDF